MCRRDIGNLLSVARSLAPSLLCQVFDIDRNEDLPGAMLLAVLHKQMNEGLEWKDCLQLIVSWNHVNIMQRSVSADAGDAHHHACVLVRFRAGRVGVLLPEPYCSDVDLP